MSGAAEGPEPAAGGTLLVHFGQMGDAVMALPAALALRERLDSFRNGDLVAGGRDAGPAWVARGGAGLTVLAAGGAPIFRLAGFDTVWPVDRRQWKQRRWLAARQLAALLARLRRGRFALSVDLHSFKETNLLVWLAGIPERIGMPRAARSWPQLMTRQAPADDYHAHLADRYIRVLEPLGIAVADATPHLEPDAESRRQLAGAWRDWAPPPVEVLGLCPGAGHPGRRWPAERFAALAAQVAARRAPGLRVAIFAGPEEDEALLAPLGAIPGARIWRGLSVAQLAAALAACAMVVSNPTGPSHIAAAVGSRVVTLGEIAPFDPRGRVQAVRARERVSDIGVDEALHAVEELWRRS